jgi:hypothetical protein
MGSDPRIHPPDNRSNKAFPDDFSRVAGSRFAMIKFGAISTGFQINQNKLQNPAFIIAGFYDMSID